MIREKLDEQLEVLYKKQSDLQKEIMTLPEGEIFVAKARGRYYQCYVKNAGKKRYLRKDQMDLVRQLVLREYDEKLLDYVEEQIKVIERFLRKYRPNDYRSVFQMMCESKRDFLELEELSDEQFIENWYRAHPACQNPYPVADPRYTEKGEIVRSKSEKMIADKLYLMGIHYVYEPILVLDENTIIYPDFMILNIRKRETYILEHYGRMDDPDYCKKVILKTENYARNGYWYGEKLFITMESSKVSWDTRLLQSLIEKYFL